MMRSETPFAAALLIAIAACAGPPEEPADPASPTLIAGDFEARQTDRGVEFSNNSAATVYYRARDPLTLALTDRVPCLSPERCPSVPAQSKVTVPFDEAVVGYRPETRTAEVYWWHFVRQPDGSLAADQVRTLEVVFDR
jgi:hypothetical protein